MLRKLLLTCFWRSHDSVKQSWTESIFYHVVDKNVFDIIIIIIISSSSSIVVVVVVVDLYSAFS